MTTLLLVVIYIAFIGLGLPDSLFGTAWPAIYMEFGLPVSWANFVTVILACGTTISSLFAASLINRFGTAAITAVSTTMAALALLGFSCAGGMLWLCLFAIPLGLAAGAIDTALNHYVAVHYRATHMNFLHCFYGVGVSLSPFLMSLALAGGSWRSGYRAVFWFQLAIAAITVLSLPLWKKVKHANVKEEEEPPKTIGLWTLLQNVKVRRACMVFIGSCGLECTAGIWGSTFLVSARGMAVDAAALMVTFYYIGMALGRFLSGVLAARVSSSQLIRVGQGVTVLAVLWLILPLPAMLSGIGLFLVGLGNGPVFPNMLHLTPQYFGKEASQSVMGIQMSASYVSILAMPALFGVLAQHVGAMVFPYYLLILCGVMVLGNVLVRRSHVAAETKQL